MQIIIRHLNYITSDNKSILQDINLSLGANKIGLIGENGIGKSTLLKLIASELTPSSGTIQVFGELAYCPQNFTPYLDKTIAEIFGVKEKLAALDRIATGSIDSKDFDIVGNDWAIKEDINNCLENFGLSNVNVGRQLKNLSGGEITKLWLTKTFAADAEMVILDEPTNNLDLSSKQLLCKAIQEWEKGLLIVSHDRTLLNLMDQIVELTTLGLNVYGGNYDHFVEQKAIIKAANVKQLQDAQKLIKKRKKTTQATQEKLQQRVTQGRKIRQTKSQPKMLLDKMQERSERTQNKLSTQTKKLLEIANKNLQAAKDKIEIGHEIKVQLPKTFVPSNKMVIELENITFAYDQDPPIINNFNLKIQGPERIALTGNNGCGKTTLVKLIQGELKPQSGIIKIGIDNISYLDQQASGLNPSLSVLDNFKLFNPDIKTTKTRYFLAQFLFRNQDALKLAINLSGGEKLRALLACVLMSSTPPQLIILDEPTNHLDLESIASIESALQCYQGAIIVISHDEKFIKNIGTTKTINEYVYE